MRLGLRDDMFICNNNNIYYYYYVDNSTELRLVSDRHRAIAIHCASIAPRVKNYLALVVEQQHNISYFTVGLIIKTTTTTKTNSKSSGVLVNSYRQQLYLTAHTTLAC